VAYELSPCADDVQVLACFIPSRSHHHLPKYCHSK
jgi:hypothetical protein